jgi:hypothetical protein
MAPGEKREGEHVGVLLERSADEPEEREQADEREHRDEEVEEQSSSS